MAAITKAELQAQLAKLQRSLAREKKKTASFANDLARSRGGQAATAEILKVIASSPSDVQPVFDAVAENSMRLLGALSATVTVRVGDALHLGALTSTDDAGDEALKRFFPLSLVEYRDTILARAALSGAPLAVSDTEGSHGSPTLREMGRRRGWRSFLAVPMMSKGAAIGTVSVTRREAGDFSEHDTELLTTFADQAVIAIENVRLFNETKEALERQTATAEILKVIASSPSDVQPVFDAIVRAAAKLCDGRLSTVLRVDGEMVNLAAHHNLGDEGVAMYRQVYPTHVSRDLVAGCAILDRTVINLPDALDEAVPTRSRALAAAGAFRAVLVVPMLREGEPIGIINVSRAEPGPFSEAHVNLLKTFADQAVIAIENVRLFNETKEALERQTATAEILAAMSDSMTDAQPVFDAIVRNLRRLFDTRFAVVQLLRGGMIEMPAADGQPGFERLRDYYPRPLDDTTIGARTMVARQVIQTSPVIGNPAAAGGTQEFAREFGFNAVMFAPMIRGDTVIGVIGIAHREAREFDDEEVALIKAFADQAVIAIENVRLFNETREALERQTATAEILKVISQSPDDLSPVFDAILERATRLCEAQLGFAFTCDGQAFDLVAQRGLETERIDQVTEALQRNRVPGPQTALGNISSTRQLVHVPDVRDTDAYRAGDPLRVSTADLIGARTLLAVPLLRDRTVVGAVVIYRREVRPFADKQLGLLQTFADQAVIAIENVRLFNETKEALERQTATAEILKVIASSPSDVQPVFEAIVQGAGHLAAPCSVAISMLEDGQLHLNAQHAGTATTTEALAGTRAVYPLPFDPARAPSARAILERKVIEIHDTDDPETPEFTQRAGRAGGFRSAVFVPLIREDKGIGTIIITHPQPGFRLSEKQLDMMRTFANQAVIAIENVRLFKELQSRTEALTRSVGQLTALGEVGQAISSTLDMETVLKTIVSRAVQLTGLDGGSIYEYDEQAEEFLLRATENADEDYLAVLRQTPIRKGEGAVGRAALTGEPVQISDVLDASYQTRLRDALIRAGYRAVLVVPLRREDHIIGALAVTRKVPGAFPPEVVELLKTFATQSALAIQNARLFREIEEKGRQLEETSHHKSQFLASMSHELRTPLNAILGFNEMILGEVYGDVPPDMKEPLDDIQTSGKHLLRLINNVLDLAKIEAGRMELSLADYAVQDMVESVRATLRPLAEAKGLAFLASVPNEVPLAYGDFGRLTQCLMNLAGNSLKFTKSGSVGISVEQNGAMLIYRVVDTGIGIPPDKIDSLFTEFKQTDASIASEYGGTGLGLSITKQFIEMHGGRIWVESVLGEGSTFVFELPLRVNDGATA